MQSSSSRLLGHKAVRASLSITQNGSLAFRKPVEVGEMALLVHRTKAGCFSGLANGNAGRGGTWPGRLRGSYWHWGLREVRAVIESPLCYLNQEIFP